MRKPRFGSAPNALIQGARQLRTQLHQFGIAFFDGLISVVDRLLQLAPDPQNFLASIGDFVLCSLFCNFKLLQLCRHGRNFIS